MTREAIYFFHIQYRVFMTHAGDHVINHLEDVG